uniref:Hematopoietic cell signal transducer n=1 Tax=Myripristis murdjan TaxID=586833 RepID=A0A667Y3I4_9TELE
SSNKGFGFLNFSFLMPVHQHMHTTSCYRIEPGTMAGIIAADLVLTVIIVIVTYLCASSRRQRRENADKVYMNVRANCKI